MKKIKNYEEYNEGLGNKIATIALGASLALGTSSCVNFDKNMRVDTELVEEDDQVDGFTEYQVDTDCRTFEVIVSKDEKVIATRYGGGKSRHIYRTIYVDNDVDVIYYNESFWSSTFLVTDDKSFSRNDDYDIIHLNKLDISSETPEYKILELNFNTYIIINKGHEPNGPTFNLDDLKVGLTYIDGIFCIIKI